jgi:signal transduction histidine kinase
MSLDEKVRGMKELIDDTIQKVRRISTTLRPGLLDDLGLSAAMEWQGKEFERRTGIRCRVEMEPEEVILENELSTAVFRIFQELLMNVARHSGATRVEVNLEKGVDRLELRVVDNGKGITEKQISAPKSLGFLGIRERVHPWGGEVRIEGIPRKGTAATVLIPFK